MQNRTPHHPQPYAHSNYAALPSPENGSKHFYEVRTHTQTQLNIRNMKNMSQCENGALWTQKDSTTEYTQSGNGRFLAYIPSWWKNYLLLVRGGGHTPYPFHFIYHHVQSCGVRSSWDGRYNPPISSLYPFLLCAFTFQLVVAKEAVIGVVLAIQPRYGLRTSVQEASAAEDNQSNHLVETLVFSGPETKRNIFPLIFANCARFLCTHVNIYNPRVSNLFRLSVKKLIYKETA